MKKVLIFGGNGFIGRNIVDVLIDNNYEVGVYDRKMCIDKRISYYCGDIVSDNIDDIISKYDIVIYLISAVMPQKSMDYPLSSYENDIPIIIKVLESCRVNGKKRIIFASSGGTVYGENEKLNEEFQQCFPINHYAICKLTCEKILLMYNLLYKMENIVLRVANPYGKYQNLSSGVGVLDTFLYNINNDKPIVVLGDGTNIRDFVNVQYVAYLFLQACHYEWNPHISPIFNVGSGQGISINELIKIISEETNIVPEVKYVERRSFDVHCNILCMEKTNKYLGGEINYDTRYEIRRYIDENKKSKN